MPKSKLGSSGRFGVRYGTLVKKRIAKIESLQKVKQRCPLCSGKAKRVSKGIWKCKKCDKKFADHAYYLESSVSEEAPKQEPLKKEIPSETKITKSKSAKTKAKN